MNTSPNHNLTSLISLLIQHLGKSKLEVSLKQRRKGSQWFEMSRELAMIVVFDTRYYPKFKNILCQSELCFIDEHYVPIVLNILKPSKIANQTLTYLFSQTMALHHHILFNGSLKWLPKNGFMNWRKAIIILTMDIGNTIIVICLQGNSAHI
jgi:hypothetical protein